MLDPFEGHKQAEIKKRKHKWGVFILASLTAYFWVSVYYFGLFQTITWSIILSAIVGLIIKLYENRY